MRLLQLAAIVMVTVGCVEGCVHVAVSAGSRRQIQRDSLVAARERWDRARIISYFLQVRRECDCPGEPRSPTELRQITHARRAPATYFDVDDLLARVQRAVEDTSVSIDSLRFDPDYGVPLLLHTARERIVVDSFSVRFGEGWGVDSMDAYRNRMAGRVRRALLDSLRAGRKRWEQAGVVEYDIQAHSECFCFGGSSRGEMLFTVRNNRVIAERQGKSLRIRLSAPVIASEMFDEIENQLGKDQTYVRKAVFHPELGIPMFFENDYIGGLTDSWYRMQVDTLIVRERRPRRRTP